MWFLSFLLSLVLAPLLAGVIRKTKAFFAGRRGPPLLQVYHDIAKLVQKGTVYSTTTTVVFRLFPTLSLAATLAAALFMPFGSAASPLAFEGDIVLFFHLLAAARMATMLGALDTGSAFEGMGSSREAQFSAFAEGVTFATLGFLALLTDQLSLTGTLTGFDGQAWANNGTSMALAVAAFFIVALAENCRVPFDDPETHLELTMIHEAMILDNGGPDLAFIHYGAALKLWLLLSFVALQILPIGSDEGLPGALAYFALMPLLAVVVGIVESIMARLRFLKVPKIFAGSLALVLVAILLFTFFNA
ncbi:MAG: respiratory chain complex I subunit 1 family protein [Kiritimatiellia bacterium]|jgi:formate hydrogenlyase subunit 4